MDAVGLQDPRGKFTSVWRTRALRLTPLGQLVVYFLAALFGLDLPRGVIPEGTWGLFIYAPVM